jgi:DNA-binding helix-hairpin-helix protein with protein kinase domain
MTFLGYLGSAGAKDDRESVYLIIFVSVAPVAIVSVIRQRMAKKPSCPRARSGESRKCPPGDEAIEVGRGRTDAVYAVELAAVPSPPNLTLSLSPPLFPRSSPVNLRSSFRFFFLSLSLQRTSSAMLVSVARHAILVISLFSVTISVAGHHEVVPTTRARDLRFSISSPPPRRR